MKTESGKVGKRESGKRIPWSELKRLSKIYSLSHVIMYAYGGETGHVVTYGRTVDNSSQAASFGNKMKEALGWPHELKEESARVKRKTSRAFKQGILVAARIAFTDFPGGHSCAAQILNSGIRANSAEDMDLMKKEFGPHFKKAKALLQ